MDQKPKTSRQLQAEHMRNLLQQIVGDMARQKTLDDIRIQDICKEANISLGNFYQYFSCKEEALIYSYQYIDDVWRNMEFEKIEDPLKRTQAIIFAHLQSIVDEPLCFITQLYIAQLKKYDSYFFTDDRYLHHVLTQAIKECQQQEVCTNKYEAKEIALKLLNFSRGLVYNYCIRHEEKPEEWLAYAKHEHREYASLFFTITDTDETK